MRLVIFGGRDFRDYQTFRTAADRYRLERGPVGKVIHGAARGADSLADRWARLSGIPREPYPADWDRWGDAAGAIRNAQMIREGKPDAGLCFPGGDGTADMLQRCLNAGLEVIQVDAAGQWWIRKAPQREKQAVFMF